MSDQAPNVKGMVNDPDFLGMSPQDQRTALFRLTNDQEFNQINDGEVVNFVNKLRTPASTEQQYAASQGAKPGLPSAVPPALTSGPLPTAGGDMSDAAKGFFRQLLKFNPVTAGQSMVSDQQVPIAPENQRTMPFSDYVRNAHLSNIVSNTASEASDAGAPGSTIAEKIGSGLATASTAVAIHRAAGAPIQGESLLPPSTARAGANFQVAMNAAGDKPIDLSAPGNTALQVQDLANSGGQMPKVVRDFLKRVTDPEQGPLTYGEARKFYVNASRLSSAEYQKLTPVMQRSVSQFTSDLGKSIQGAADDAGVGAEHQAAMTEFANASRLKRGVGTATDAIVKYLPYAAAGYTVKKVIESLPRQK